jgi:Chaperone of endosialidase
MTIDTAGNVGIGATSPDMLLSVGSNSPTGAVAHFENSTGSCYINPTNTGLSCSSDARLKTNITPLPDADGLDALLKLGPVTFNWKNESATSSHHSGFIAQEVQQVLPDLVSQGPDGYYTMNYAGLVTYIVKAVQELASQLSDITNTVTSFAERFVTKELVATNGTFDHLTAKTLCVEDICVSRDQLAALLAAAGQSGASSSWTQSSTASTMPATSSSPVISVNGNNPAHINVGDSYSDLGARIIGPTEADTNLGLRYFVDGALVPFVSLDTSTSTTTRTVIVQAHEQMTFAQPTPPPPEEATSSAATSTSATTTPQ